ncbi:unnamed protein product [Caenorhabditis brenneri]
MSRQTGGSNLTNQVVTNADAAQSQPHQQPPVNNFVPDGPMPTTVNSEMGDGMQGNFLPSAQDQGTTSLVHQRDEGCEPAPAQARNQDPSDYFQPAPTSSTFQELLPELLGNDRNIVFFLQAINGGTYLPTTDNATPLSPIIVPQVSDRATDKANVQTPSNSVSNSKEVVEPQKKDQKQQQELTKFNKPRDTNEQKKARRRETHAQNTALLNKNPEEIEDPKEAERRQHLEKIRIARNERNRERKKNMTEEQKEKAKESSRRYRKAKRKQHLINHPKPTESEKKQAAAHRRKEKREENKRLGIAAKQVSSEQPSTSQQHMSQ